MKNIRIGADFDGTIVKTGQLQRDVAKELFGKDIPPTLRSRNAVYDKGLTPHEYEIVSTEALTNLKYLNQLEMQPNARKVLLNLIEKGVSFEISTARKGKEFEFAKNYLEQNGIYIPIKSTERGQDKSQLVRGLDVYLEDMPYQIPSLRKIVPRIILFNTYDNSKEMLTTDEEKQVRGIERISDWKELKL